MPEKKPDMKVRFIFSKDHYKSENFYVLNYEDQLKYSGLFVEINEIKPEIKVEVKPGKIPEKVPEKIPEKTEKKIIKGGE